MIRYSTCKPLESLQHLEFSFRFPIVIKSLDTALLQEFLLHAFAVHFTLYTSVRLIHFILPPLHPGTVSLDPGPRLLSVWFFHPFRLPAFLFSKNFPLLSLLLVCPFPAILRLCRHECLATVSLYFQRMLVSLFASSRVVL